MVVVTLTAGSPRRPLCQRRPPTAESRGRSALGHPRARAPQAFSRERVARSEPALVVVAAVAVVGAAETRGSLRGPSARPSARALTLTLARSPVIVIGMVPPTPKAKARRHGPIPHRAAAAPTTAAAAAAAAAAEADFGLGQAAAPTSGRLVSFGRGQAVDLRLPRCAHQHHNVLVAHHSLH